MSLQETVAARRAEVEARPAPPPPPTAGFGDIDQERVLQIIGLNPRDPKAHAVIAVAQRYGLDPVLGHIQIIGGTSMPYVTRDGYLHIAHRSGQLDGIEVSDGPRREGNEWMTIVSVFRKDMSRPFRYPGRADLGRENGPEMSLARAERRALKRAFAVTLPYGVFADDEHDMRAPVEAVEEPTFDLDAPINPAGIAALQAGFRTAGIDRAERLALVSQWVRRDVATAKDLTMGEASEVLARLAEIQQDTTAEQPQGDNDNDTEQGSTSAT